MPDAPLTVDEILDAEDALLKAEHGKNRPRQKELAGELADLRRRWSQEHGDDPKAARHLRVAREQRILDQEG